MKYSFAILTVALLFACNAEKKLAESTEEIDIAEQGASVDSVEVTQPSKPQRPYQLKAKIGDVSQRSDACTITSARIEGNTLWIDVEYSGGCGWHKFELIGSAGIMKSLPPQRSIKLVHDNDDDMCEGWVKQTIEADITNLAASQTSGSEIVLILDGYNEKLKYTYP